MTTLMQSMKRFVREEDAPTTMEYGLLACLIAIVAIAAMTLFGSNTNSLYAVKF